MKQLKVFVVIIFLAMLFTGCWSRKELTDIGIIGMTHVDKADDVVILTIEMIKPSMIEKETDTEPAEYLQSDGKTITDALRNVTMKYEKRPFLSHSNACLFTEEVSKEGLNDYLEFFNRYYEARRFVHVAVNMDLTVDDLITLSQEKDMIPSVYIESLFENYNASGKSTSVKLIDFLKAYYDEGIEPVAGVIRMDTACDTANEERKNVSVEGMALFKEDKLVGFFDCEETRDYNLIAGKIKKGVFIEDVDFEKELAAVEVLNVKSNMGVKYVDEKPIGVVSLDIACMLSEYTGTRAITEYEEVNNLEKNLAKHIADDLKGTLKKAQDYQADVFGFGRIIHHKYPKKWQGIKEEWPIVFSSLPIEVEVKVEVERVGVTNQQIKIK